MTFCSNVLKHRFERLAFINFDFASLCRVASRWLLGWASLLPPSLSTILSTSWHQQQSTKVFCSFIFINKETFLNCEIQINMNVFVYLSVCFSSIQICSRWRGKRRPENCESRGRQRRTGKDQNNVKLRSSQIE